MKKEMLFKLFYLNVCFMLLFSCAGKVSNQIANSDTEMTKPYQYGWTTKIVLNNPGTRSEGRTFSLYYKTKLIPYVFVTIYAGGQGFRFKQKINLWDSAGYVPVDNVIKEITQETITAAELSQGWYYGTSWKINTPSHWCLATRDTVSAVIDPLKLNEFLLQHEWKEYSLYNIELPIQP